MIPLGTQLAAFDERASDVLDGLPDYIAERRHIILEMARERLVSGYAMYQDRMFFWDAATRERNALEEAADLLNYLLSGEE